MSRNISRLRKILSEVLSVIFVLGLQLPLKKYQHSFNQAVKMDTEEFQTSYFYKPEARHEAWRHHCGCIRTSEKLKQILNTFPSTPPPSPSNHEFLSTTLNNTCISAYCTGVHQPLTSELPQEPEKDASESIPTENVTKVDTTKTWRMVAELVQLLQLSVTATALALYYLIYCYMQLVYYTLRSALYFHNADGPMKITIGVVTVTSLVVGFNLIIRMERLIGIFH